MTLEGSLSNGGTELSPPLRRPILPLLRGRVPLVTSGQPLDTKSSTRLVVAATLNSPLLTAVLLPPPEDLLIARLWAALAYARHVRPSWSTAFRLAPCCNHLNKCIIQHTITNLEWDTKSLSLVGTWQQQLSAFRCFKINRVYFYRGSHDGVIHTHLLGYSYFILGTGYVPVRRWNRMSTPTRLGLTEGAAHNQWTTSQTNYTTSTWTLVTDEELQATDQSCDRLHDDDDDDL